MGRSALGFSVRAQGLRLDMLIAAQAISLDATFVTADRAFLSITDLAVENWREVG